MPVPTARLALLALGLAGVRLLLPDDFPGGVLLLDGLLLALAAIDWSLAMPPARIGFERVLPSTLTVGFPSSIAWRVGNPTARPVRVTIADELPPAMRADRRRATCTVPPRSTTEVVTAIVPARRGRFVLREVVVRVAGPLGLVTRQRARRVDGEVRVLPVFRSRAAAELRIERARVLEVGLRSAQGRGGGTEFEQLREWGPDDEFRRMDWAATARAGRPIVRTYRADRNQQVLVLFDNGRTAAALVEGVPRGEHAMDAALLLATISGRLGDRCGLVVFDSEVRQVLPPVTSRRQADVFAEALFDLHPDLVEPDYRGAFAHVVARFRRRSLVVLLTDLAEQSVGEYLLPALGLIANRHLVVVAAALDPQLERWADHAEDPFLRLAAFDALEERHRVAARLRRLGVTVVDARPDQLAGAVGDVYLRTKATGRL